VFPVHVIGMELDLVPYNVGRSLYLDFLLRMLVLEQNTVTEVDSISYLA
jgi:hypothetical protein